MPYPSLQNERACTCHWVTYERCIWIPFRQVFDFFEVAPISAGDRLPTMAPFPQKWIPTKDNVVCDSGMALYQCELIVAKDGILGLMFSPAEIDTIHIHDVFEKVIELNLGASQLSDIVSYEYRDQGLLSLGETGFTPTMYSGYYGELIASEGWPCGYVANSTFTLAGNEEAKRLPPAVALHDGHTTLETECQSRQITPGGKDYGGNLNVTYAGKACVPWKDLVFFDVDFSYIEGNSCRYDTHGHARCYFAEDRASSLPNMLACQSCR